jgi:quinol monooxygenase YgiN
MIIVAGHMTIPGGRMADLLPVALATVMATRKEPGCILYSFATDIADPTLLRIYEEWESRAALEAHFKQPHMTPWRAKLDEVGATDRAVFSFEAGARRPI